MAALAADAKEYGFQRQRELVPKVHRRDTRLFVNAGMNFPACYANEKLLDCDKGRFPVTTVAGEVTCRNCWRIKRR